MSKVYNAFSARCVAPTTQASCKQKVDDFENMLCYYHKKLALGLLDSSEGVEIDIDDTDI